jgi:hypothetical protein
MMDTALLTKQPRTQCEGGLFSDKPPPYISFTPSHTSLVWEMVDPELEFLFLLLKLNNNLS